MMPVEFTYKDGVRAYTVTKPFEGVLKNLAAPLAGDRQRLGARGNVAATRRKSPATSATAPA